MKSAYSLLFGLTIFIFACNNKPLFPIEPHIEYIDIQPRSIHEYKDSMVIRFHFQDGDGDLGDVDGGDTFSLISIDNRTQFPDTLRTLYFKLPDLKVTTKKPSIMGEVALAYPPTVITPGYTRDSTSFTIFILDKAGHKSNEIITDKIYIEH